MPISIRSVSVRVVLCLLVAWVMTPVAIRPAAADTINIGIVSFDVFTPPVDNNPGVVAINLLNLTGDPLSGGFALDPDFPSYTALTLLDASLTLIVDGIEQVLLVGDVGPGSRDPIPDLLFPDTSLISSLALSATLSTTGVVLGNSTALLASSNLVTLTMLPALGGAFTAGVDVAVISVEGAAPPVPEPVALPLIAIGLAAKRAWTRRRRQSAG